MFCQDYYCVWNLIWKSIKATTRRLQLHSSSSSEGARQDGGPATDMMPMVAAEILQLQLRAEMASLNWFRIRLAMPWPLPTPLLSLSLSPKQVEARGSKDNKDNEDSRAAGQLKFTAIWLQPRWRDAAPEAAVKESTLHLHFSSRTRD